MKIIRDLEKIFFENKITATIGGYDGIHIGHNRIISKVVQKAKENNSKSALITFKPLPKIFFARKNFELLTIYKKIEILKELNVDYMILLRFNDSLISMSSKDFIEEILIKKLNISSLTVGHDFKFGKNQSGSVSDLQDYAHKGFFTLNVEEKHSIAGERISSSSIRDYIMQNNFEKASKMLGRPYTVSGKIIHGDKRGRTIGFPTANIKLEPNILLSGVYAVSTLFKKKKYYGVANIGYKPTFDGQRYLFEANIFDFSQDLYGQRLEFDIISKIRETKKFSGVEELKKYINLDVKSVKEIFKLK